MKAPPSGPMVDLGKWATILNQSNKTFLSPYSIPHIMLSIMVAKRQKTLQGTAGLCRATGHVQLPAISVNLTNLACE